MEKGGDCCPLHYSLGSGYHKGPKTTLAGDGHGGQQTRQLIPKPALKGN